jgi:CheW protein
MLHPETGEVVGILCLCFDFEKEMRGIFESHRDPEERANMVLLDSENRVIASADTLWMPLGAVVPVNRSGSTRLMMFGGRKYLVQTFVAEGYQGYMGPPGWQGQVMVPVEVAFMENGNSTLASLDPAIADGLLSHAQTFSPPLYKIMQAAETIQRVVWNGQVMTAGHGNNLLQLKSVLEQISETGNRSNELFSQSIGNLYETVLGSSLRGTEFMSHLLVDLLDRNLYERSNDCRWWALTASTAQRFGRAGADRRHAGEHHRHTGLYQQPVYRLHSDIRLRPKRAHYRQHQFGAQGRRWCSNRHRHRPRHAASSTLPCNRTGLLRHSIRSDAAL